MDVKSFFVNGENRKKAALSQALVLFVCIFLCVWTFPGEVREPAGFEAVSPKVLGNEWSSRLVSRMPGIYREPDKSDSGKMSYGRFSGGDTMYSMYFGLLNIRSGPDAEASVATHAAYGDSLQVYWKEDSGYVRVRYKKPYSKDWIEGYCIMEELSEAAPSDGRVFLDIPDYKQYDERWGELPLGESYETIASAGCATSCLAMSYSYLEGEVTTPDGMAERLFYDEEGNLGFPKVYEKNWDTDYLEIALSKLQEGIPVLIGGFTEKKNPHWVLITGYTGDGTELKAPDFLINDPASEERPTLAEFFRDYPIYNKIVYYAGEDS